MRSQKVDLLTDVVGTYDQTKTTTQGRVFSKTVDGKVALGPPLNKFIDLQTDTGITLAANNMIMTDNGRVFVLSSEAAGLVNLILYSLNYSTGAYTYVGRVLFQFPDIAATTHVFRSIKANDTGTSGWKIFVVSTGNVTINGGPYLLNDLALSDFVQVGFPTIPFATGNNQKAVYKLEESGAQGTLHPLTAAAGAVLDKGNDRFYVHNGVAATHQYYVYDTSVAPTYSNNAITGVAATDIITDTGHPYVDNDPITFQSLTGGAGLTVNSIYFVRNSVAGVSYQVSATSGGSAINFTTDITDGTAGRAWGNTTALFLHKTGNLPALSGTLLLTDSEDYAEPDHTANSGQPCAFFATTANIYMGQLAELTNGATSWPSLVVANIIGTPNEIVTPVATYAAWSNMLDRAVVSVNAGSIYIMKQMVNNVIDRIFGGTSNRYLEGFNFEAIELGTSTAITTMDLEQGWLGVINSGATGQRGIILADLRSDALFDHSFLVTKVINTPASVYKFITTIDALYDFTGSLSVFYRISGFGSISGGWNPLPFAEGLDLFATGDQVQFKIAFDTLSLDTSIPAQLCEFFLGYESLTDNSENWELSVDDSDNGNPSRTAFRLKTAYASGTVPPLRYMALDLTNVLLVDQNTTSHAARFEYSTNSGASWNAVGTIPNTVGTMVRYTFVTPPGVDIRPSLKEL